MTAPGTAKRVCKNCRSFAPSIEEPGWGLCRYNAPTCPAMVLEQDSKPVHYLARWPHLLAGEWCRKWEAILDVVEPTHTPSGEI